ncbi:MAG: hypothetical protein EOO92_03750 [Pedobacter sp.]|nr:MAG: hypothetical protein EOO92_03750 [Pedobacter sp.]
MKLYFITIALLFCSVSLAAQYDDPGLPGGDPDVPIDGGVALLLLAGTAYGIKKIRDTKR